MASQAVDVVVIGAGLVGLLAACDLVQRGLSVCVLERDRPGAHASGLNAGGLRTVGRHPSEFQLSIAAAVLWRDAADRIGPGVRMHVTGHLLLAESQAEADVLDTHWAAMQAAGLAIAERLDPEAISRLVPSMRRGAHAALYAPGDGMADPALTMAAAVARAGKVGVRVRSGHAVRGIRCMPGSLDVDTTGGRFSAGCVVNAAGAFTGAVASMLGEDLPVRIEAPMAQRSAPAPAILGPVIQTVGRKLTLKQLPDGRMLTGGGHRGGIDMAAPGGLAVEAEAQANRATAADLFPALACVGVEAVWAGLEGYTADRLPIIGRSCVDARVVHAGAFCGHGFQLAPAVAPLVADLVMGDSAAAALLAFQPGRFAAGVPADMALRAG